MLVIEEIYNIAPLKVKDETGKEVFVTHLVEVEDENDNLVLLSDYTQEPIALFPARLHLETGVIGAVSVEENKQIAEYIEKNPISVISKEYAEEASKSWITDSVTE